MPVSPETEFATAYTQGRSAAALGQVRGLNPYVLDGSVLLAGQNGGWNQGYDDQIKDAAMRPVQQVQPPLFTQKFTLTSAQILAAFTTPVQLLPALAGRGYAPEKAAFVKRVSTIAYTLAGVTAMQLAYSGGVITAFTQAVLAGFLDQTAAKSVVADDMPSDGAALSVRANILLATHAVNQALNFQFTGANPAAGNGLLDIFLSYRIYDDGASSF